MVMITFIEADGRETSLDIIEGTTLMNAAVDNDVEGINGDCGGACSCATCHCYIDGAFIGKIPPVSDLEQSMLDFATDPQANSRLGCQVVVTADLSGLVVRLPQSQG